MASDSDDQEIRASRNEKDVHELTTQVSFLEEEVSMLRRRLTESPRHLRVLEERLAEAQSRVATLTERNEKLTSTLREARDQIVALKEEVDRLAQPPSGYGVFLQTYDDGTVDVFTGGRKLRVAVSPSVELEGLRVGQEVMLNEALNVVLAREFERAGDVVMLKEVLDGGDRALVIGHTDEERIVHLADTLLTERLRAGDSLLLEPRSGYVYEKIPKSEVEELILEEVPDIDYTDIGGLSAQIEQIRDAVELPFLHADLFREHELRPPKGVLLYGPPGCGKTLIAKAVANSLAKKVAEVRGEDAGRSYFLNIKGPELLNKYVGETERHIRLVFQRAREKASEGTPVIVFFDEMDSIFRTRGSGVSSDVENTIVPQLLSEIDGVEGLENVIVIGASNREDMIDPAILRPGRLDVKIKIERPDAEAARDIFSKYVTTTLPLHADDLAEHGGSRQATVAAMIQRAVERMYTETEDNRFLEVTYANGDKEVLYFKDFNSGAMIQNIVDRAKKMAIKDFLEQGRRACACSTCSPPAWTSSGRTRTCPTPPTRTTGPASPARRASGSSTSARSSPARAPSPVGRSTRSPTPVSTCSRRPEARDRRARCTGSAPPSSVRAMGAGARPAPRRIGVSAVSPEDGRWRAWPLAGRGRRRRASAPAGAVRHVRESLRCGAGPVRGRRRRRARRRVPGVNRVLRAAATATVALAVAGCGAGQIPGHGAVAADAATPGGGQPTPSRRRRGDPGPGRHRGLRPGRHRRQGHDPARRRGQGQQGRRLPLPDPGERHRLQPGGHRHRRDPARRRLGVRPGPGRAERLVVGLGRAVLRRPATDRRPGRPQHGRGQGLPQGRPEDRRVRALAGQLPERGPGLRPAAVVAAHLEDRVPGAQHGRRRRPGGRPHPRRRDVRLVTGRARP